jgi:hypothetical protein
VELRHAIRVVFDASIAAMTDEEASSAVENWQLFGELSLKTQARVGLKWFVSALPSVTL